MRRSFVSRAAENSTDLELRGGPELRTTRIWDTVETMIMAARRLLFIWSNDCLL
jgi:hypothetical protein